MQGDPGVAAGEDAAGARGSGPGVQYTGQENRDPQPPGGFTIHQEQEYNIQARKTETHSLQVGLLVLD